MLIHKKAEVQASIADKISGIFSAKADHVTAGKVLIEIEPTSGNLQINASHYGLFYPLNTLSKPTSIVGELPQGLSSFYIYV